MRSFLSVAASACVLIGSAAGTIRAEDQVLFNVRKGVEPAVATAADSQLSVAGGALHVKTGTKSRWPGVTLKAPAGKWNLAARSELAVDLRNPGKAPVVVFVRVDNPGADGVKHCVTGQVQIPAKESRTLRIPLNSPMPAALEGKLFGMRGYPNNWNGKAGIDPAAINQLVVFVSDPKVKQAFDIVRVAAVGNKAAASVDPSKFFPMIDRYGQYMHKQWPGKTASDADLAAHAQAEQADLAAHPGPADWSRYGGWKSGPKLPAKGFFYVAQHDGRWWLVDPEGFLFWSHGNDCVGHANSATPISEREYLYAELPKQDSPADAFYGSGNWAPHNYYEGKTYRTYDFGRWNLLRKYGDDWRAVSDDLVHRRLRSWSMNTIGNWSDVSIARMHRTPYTATVGTGGRRLEGSQGYWGKFYDVFDPSFRAAIRKAMEGEKGKSAGDPWCLGYFVDNELSWNDDLSLAIAAAQSPADQPAKKVFLADLRAKYGAIDQLNAVWGTSHASWDAWLQSTAAPDKKKAAADLGEFHGKLAEEYFRICREAVKEVAPNQLYLGCRFAWANDRAIRAACKYCDVVSFNRYERSIAKFRLPAGENKPMIIGEFHFGALDRGMLHTGLVPCTDQEERAEAYRQYVRGALSNPWFVGTHWFQYRDQATTGRGDGENYQIGFVDGTDRPYAETVTAAREVGTSMYKFRSEKGERLPSKD